MTNLKNKLYLILGSEPMTHPDCGVLRLKDELVQAYSITRIINTAILIAGMPCARYVTGNILKRFRPRLKTAKASKPNRSVL